MVHMHTDGVCKAGAGTTKLIGWLVAEVRRFCMKAAQDSPKREADHHALWYFVRWANERNERIITRFS